MQVSTWRKAAAALTVIAVGASFLGLKSALAGDATGFGAGGMHALTNTDNLISVSRPNGNVVSVGVEVFSKIVGAEWTATGSPVGTFGTNGRSTIQAPGTTSGSDANRIYEAQGIQLLADGRVVVVFSHSSGSALAMLRADGTLDPAFGGGDGYSTDAHCGSVTDLLADPTDGSLYTVAYGNGECEGTTLRRYTSAGVRDAAWGNQQISGGHRDGRVYANDAVLDASGRILVTGQSNDSRFGVLRVTKAGVADATFGSAGFVGLEPSPGQGSEYFGYETGFPVFYGSKFATGIALDSTGRIVVSGNSRAAAGQDLDLVTFRLAATGTIDTTFGTAGRSVVDSGSDRDDYPQALVIDSADRPVVTGSTRTGSGPRLQFVTRLTTAGVRDTSTDTTGTVVSPFGTTHAFVPFGAVLGAAGRVYVSGSYIEASGGMVRGYTSAIDLATGTTTTTAAPTTTGAPTTTTTAPTTTTTTAPTTTTTTAPTTSTTTTSTTTTTTTAPTTTAPTTTTPTTTTTAPSTPPLAPSGAVRVVGDFNGDGRDDVLWYRSGTATDLLWIATASGFTTSAVTMTTTAEPMVGDYNGDGRDDVLWYRGSQTSLVLWSGQANGTFLAGTLTVKL